MGAEPVGRLASFSRKKPAALMEANSIGLADISPVASSKVVLPLSGVAAAISILGLMAMSIVA